MSAQRLRSGRGSGASAEDGETIASACAKQKPGPVRRRQSQIVLSARLLGCRSDARFSPKIDYGIPRRKETEDERARRHHTSGRQRDAAALVLWAHSRVSCSTAGRRVGRLRRSRSCCPMVRHRRFTPTLRMRASTFSKARSPSGSRTSRAIAGPAPWRLPQEGRPTASASSPTPLACSCSRRPRASRTTCAHSLNRPHGPGCNPRPMGHESQPSV